MQSNATEYLQGEVDVSPSSGAVIITGHAPTITQGLGIEAIDQMILGRLEAKKSKNFAESDRIRKKLADAGIILEDSPQGTTWRRA